LRPRKLEVVTKAQLINDIKKAADVLGGEGVKID
jgi:hypothetical protein